MRGPLANYLRQGLTRHGNTAVRRRAGGAPPDTPWPRVPGRAPGRLPMGKVYGHLTYLTAVTALRMAVTWACGLCGPTPGRPRPDKVGAVRVKADISPLH
jgi:hypothetical protein